MAKKWIVTAVDTSESAVNRGDMETAGRMVREFAADEFPVSANIEARWIEPVNGIQDKAKFDHLVKDFKKNGWSGRPILAWNDDGYHWQAFTGSHRILAAREAGIDVPVYEIPREVIDRGYSVLEENGKSGDDFISASDDDTRDEVFRSLVEDYGIRELALPRKLLNLEENLNDAVTYDDSGNVIPLSQRFNTQNPDVRYSVRTAPPPRETGIGYKVFYQKNGKLYPPMVANPGGADTPVGIWLDADAAPVAGTSKTGRPQVKQGGKGTQGGSGLQVKSDSQK